MNKEILKQLGFLDAEIDVYTALLRLGSGMVSDIHQATGHHRTHIYDLLEKLREKGLVSVYISSGKKHFQPAPPSTILSYIEEKKESVQSLLPEMEQLMNLPKIQTSVELFKGKDGLKSVLQDVINVEQDYYVMGSIKQFEEILLYALPPFLKRVAKKGMKEFILSDKREDIKRIASGEYKHLDGNYLFPSSVWMYDTKVALFVWNLPYFAIVIDSKDIHDTYKSYFDFFWSIAKP